jgi:hypothetical protein
VPNFEVTSGKFNTKSVLVKSMDKNESLNCIIINL